MKCFVIFALVGAAVAYPRPDDIPVRAYGPPPVAAYGKPEEHLPPQPYQYEYGVSDQYSGSNYQAVESQDPQGTVIGSYRVNLPDGRVQTVTYKADHQGGFVADVKYEGEAIYPPEPKEGYGKTYAVPAPAPPPRYAPAPPAPRYGGPAVAVAVEEEDE